MLVGYGAKEELISLETFRRIGEILRRDTILARVYNQSTSSGHGRLSCLNLEPDGYGMDCMRTAC